MQHPVSPGALAIPGPFQHELVHTRGTRLHAATAGNPRAPFVLLLHDALGGWFDFLRLIPLLSADFHVAAATARGFGQSDKPPSGYTIRFAVGDAAGLIGALGHEDAVVVAHGSATRAATTLAANYPERVQRLILIDPLGRNNLWTVRRNQALARVSSRVPQRVARKSLLDPTESSELVELRSLAYQVGGTHAARLKHTRLPLAPLPINWHSTAQQPTSTLHGMPQWYSPEECAATIIQV
ncbi:alpha/beta fold hydrolase [Corynebacterium epidermidicanis]|uniref:Alpha/beta hydrolase family n=1 Tax=Corynebacterium epidermidicanis TaxID=1050174 RepID=A0A0G3GTM8_9CORY|nr:alpha/beta fold hydrolase [Corynebacterium epidermidicanis]AKK02167.1 Alpha/beta hydrolase family [Corynebacterium epidermidicanis]